jgi:hypothetical protein
MYTSIKNGGIAAYVKEQYTITGQGRQEHELPHKKSNRNETMPQIENVTQIKIRVLEGGYPNGVKHERKTGGNQGIQAPLPEGNEKKGFCLTSSPG